MDRAAGFYPVGWGFESLRGRRPTLTQPDGSTMTTEAPHLARSDLPYLDTSSPAFALDPHTIFDELRAAGPVVRDELGWSTLDYATSESVFHDTALVPGIDHLLAARGIGALWAEPGHTLTDAEGEAHRRLRRAISPWFSARRVELLRTRTRALVDELLDDVGSAGEIDVMASLADVVPARLFCWMIGAPDGDAPLLARLSKVLLSVFTATDAMVEPVRAAKVELAGYTAELLHAARHAPSTDEHPVGALVDAVRSGQIDPGDEAFLLEELLSAAVDNTANTAALALLTLAEHPDAWRAVHEDESLLPSAVEECGRFEPAIRHTTKAAVRPTHVGDVAISVGELVTVRVAAAQRDPATYPDPHLFDIGRVKPATQLAFGAGRHYCLGAALARMEVLEIVRGLTSRWQLATVSTEVDMDRYTDGVVRVLTLREAR